MDAVILAMAFLSFLSLVLAWLVFPQSSRAEQPAAQPERTTRVLEAEPA
jgi:hypothetical protein